MSNIILKIGNGELFDFFDSETKKEFIVGSKRTCDVVIKGFLAAPEQLRFIQKNNVWYVEDLTPEGHKSEVLIGGKRFKRPVVRFDGDIVIRKVGEKKGDGVKISAVKKINRRRSGSNFDLTQKTLTVVGSDASCDIVVNNPMVSDKHFRIVYDGSDYYIEDLRSINGTFVNNRRIRRAKLGDYDRISIPAAAYTFFDRKLLYSTSPAGIQVDAVGVTKEVPDRNSHGRIKLVNGVSFRVEPGAFVAVVGGSGTGKSTLLDCLNGIRPATGGGIYYDTNNYYDNIKSYKNVIGYVPQRDIMHDDLTVERGLYYTAMLRVRTNMSREEVKQRVQEAIADVRLTGREKLKISSLSGGQRKRVSIAMELLSDPKVIFLDEPTSGLSPDLDLEMMDLLKELAAKGRTIIVITHAMENLDKCDKIAFLGKNGRLCFYGEHKEVFRYFNRKNYSRIFAALNDETVCAYFEHKYRSTDYYKELYASFCELYPDAKENMLPPETGKKTLRQTAEEANAVQPPTRRTLSDVLAGLKKKLRSKAEEAPESEEQAPRISAQTAAEDDEAARAETAEMQTDEGAEAREEAAADKARRDEAEEVPAKEQTAQEALSSPDKKKGRRKKKSAEEKEQNAEPSEQTSTAEEEENSPSGKGAEEATASPSEEEAENTKPHDEQPQTADKPVETADEGADAPPVQLTEKRRGGRRKKAAAEPVADTGAEAASKEETHDEEDA